MHTAVLRHLHRRPGRSGYPRIHRRQQYHVVFGLPPYRLYVAALPGSCRARLPGRPGVGEMADGAGERVQLYAIDLP